VILGWLLLLSGLPAGAPPAGFVLVPAGSLGETVIARPFWAERTEVTVDRFSAFVKATGYRTAAEVAGASRTWRKPGFELRGRQPVVYVTFRDAEAYCAWTAARLPTDAEWEYAARAGATGRHFWGDAIDGRYLWYRANSGGRPRDAGTKRPNRWGLHDVEGNVWEWSVSREPAGAVVANRRGGSWVDCEDIDGGPGRGPSPLVALANAYRIRIELDHRYDDIGFRCVRDLP
jgi:formylglycine-generating enzyme required for sulfatase activity